MNHLFLDVEDFFHRYWKRKALYLPQALANFKSPLSEDELAGLACEKMVESRIVLEHGSTPWELRQGPFKVKDFQKLPTSHWTLLVQAVNHWVPQVSDILDYFDFLPHHFLDDIMVSYAPPQGSVGAHFDYYDVFILQGTGKRRWQLGEFCSPETPTRKETPLGILQQFNVHEEYLLVPGDILYIPQQQAHWCVTEEAGLSYSIGFRTPSYSELINSFCNELFNQLNESQRISIVAQSHASAPAALDNETINNVWQIFQNLIQNPQSLRNWLGCFLTEPKYPELMPQPTPEKFATVDKLLAKYSWLRHNESSRLAYCVTNNGVYLFVDGESYEYPAQQLDFIALLCNHRQLATKSLLAYMSHDAHKKLLQWLLSQGTLYFS